MVERFLRNKGAEGASGDWKPSEGASGDWKPGEGASGNWQPAKRRLAIINYYNRTGVWPVIILNPG